MLDFYDDFEGDDFYKSGIIKNLNQYLGHKYNFIYDKKPDYVIYGSQGNAHLRFDCIRIFLQSENVRADFNTTDYVINHEYMEFEDRFLHYNAMVDFNTTRQKSDVRNRFCAFIVSNGTKCSPREMFFDRLSEYKKVDSAGKWRNNIGTPLPKTESGGFFEAKMEFLKHYKFNLCFENGTSPGYVTEKLFDSFKAGCIPIYWGDTSLRCGLGLESKNGSEIDMRIPQIRDEMLEFIINPKAFINAHNFSCWDELIDEIKRIDNDESAYCAMLNEPIFLKKPEANDFYNQKLIGFLDYIFSQDLKRAKRRGIGQFMEQIEANLIKNERPIIKFIVKKEDKLYAHFRKYRNFYGKFYKPLKNG